jgi:PiT family inorganic phosphate transporter
MDGIHPVGVLGILIALAVTPLLAAGVGLVVIRTIRRLWRRATRRWLGPVRGAQWTMSGALAFSHGANDAQKTIGVLATLLVANGQIHSSSTPVSVKLACAIALTIGTALGGWRIIRTVGRGIYPIRPVESLASQTASAGVIFGAALAGAPTSTSQVVSSSIVGIGGGRRRWRHVHWEIVERIGLAWLITLPASAVLGVVALGLWQAM